MADERWLWGGSDAGKAIRRTLLQHQIDDNRLADDIYIELYVIEKGLFPPLTAEQYHQLDALRGEIAQLESHLDAVHQLPTVAWRIGGLIDDANIALEKLRQALAPELKRNKPQIKRPTTQRGDESIRVFEVLQKAGIADVGKCSEIIAEIFAATGRAETADAKLKRALYDRLKRRVR